MKSKPQPKTVELVRFDYQPTKAELKEEFDLRIPGDTGEEWVDFLGRALSETVNVRWVDSPRKRRA